MTLNSNHCPACGDIIEPTYPLHPWIAEYYCRECNLELEDDDAKPSIESNVTHPNHSTS